MAIHIHKCHVPNRNIFLIWHGHRLLKLYVSARLLGTPERAQVLLAACQHPLLGQLEFCTSLLPRVVALVLAAPTATRQLLVKWWAEYPKVIWPPRDFFIWADA
jgi:hypothetical protein